MSLHSFATWLQSTSLSTAIQSSSWLVPVLQSTHIVMIGVVFVSVLIIASRVLGLARVDEPLGAVWRRFSPFLWGGLAVMAASGLLLTVAEPVREFMTLSFRLKLLLLAAGVAGAVLFGRRVRGLVAGDPRAAARPSGALRLAAAATILLWLAVIFLGRAIAYDDTIWGSWSPAAQHGAGES